MCVCVCVFVCVCVCVCENLVGCSMEIRTCVSKVTLTG